MAPHGEAISSTFTKGNNFSKPARLSNDSLQRTISDISFELSKEAADMASLPPVSEVEDARCECCGLSEECTPEYIEKVRSKFLRKWICGLCSEAVKEEFDKNGGTELGDALTAHMNACANFNKYGIAYPVLHQAEAMRQMLKRSACRGKSLSPKDKKGGQKNGGITRSSSCIPAITREINDLHLAN